MSTNTPDMISSKDSLSPFSSGTYTFDVSPCFLVLFCCFVIRGPLAHPMPPMGPQFSWAVGFSNSMSYGTTFARNLALEQLSVAVNPTYSSRGVQERAAGCATPLQSTQRPSPADTNVCAMVSSPPLHVLLSAEWFGTRANAIFHSTFPKTLLHSISRHASTLPARVPASRAERSPALSSGPSSALYFWSISSIHSGTTDCLEAGGKRSSSSGRGGGGPAVAGAGVPHIAR